jgi:Fe-S-cluster containining protein
MSDQLKKFTLLIDSQSGKSIDIEVPDKPLAVSGIVPLMHLITDHLVQAAIHHCDSPVTCSKGCGVCCKQLVPLAIPEVFFIVERLLEMPAALRTPVLQKFEFIEKNLETDNFIGSLRTIDQTKNDRAIAERYFRAGLDCPFLEHGSCSIHPWRPVVCREFNSLSDPLLCNDPFTNKVKALSYRRRPSEILAKLYSMLTDSTPVLTPVPLLFEAFERYRQIALKTWQSTFLVEKMLDLIFS